MRCALLCVLLALASPAHARGSGEDTYLVSLDGKTAPRLGSRSERPVVDPRGRFYEVVKRESGSLTLRSTTFPKPAADDAWTVRVPLKGGLLSSSVTPDLFVLRSGKELIAVEPATGAERWRLGVSSVYQAFHLVGTVLYGADQDGSLQRVDLASGRIAWTTTLPEQALKVQEGLALGSTWARFFDPKTGATRRHVKDVLMAGHGRCYVRVAGAIQAQEAKGPTWKIAAGEKDSLWIAGPKHVLVWRPGPKQGQGRSLVLEASSGKVLHKTPGTLTVKLTDVGLLLSDGKVLRLLAEGKSRWEVKLENVGAIAECAGKLVVVTRRLVEPSRIAQTRLVALSVKDGTQEWTRPVPPPKHYVDRWTGWTRPRVVPTSPASP
jgi:outer membrane protein assembly factor BamB